MSEQDLDEQQERSSSVGQGVPQGRAADRAGYWKANIRLIGLLLCVWAAVSFGCGILFVEQLNAFTIGGLPLGFWFAQQGSIYVFIVLIFIYAVGMDRLDKKYGVRQE